MSNRFTEKAEKALNATTRIAEELGHTYIGTEHILLSLVSDEVSSSAFILRKHGVSVQKLRKVIREYSGTGAKSTLSSKDMTPRARRILESSYSNAIKYGTGVIGTEHILLSLVEEKDSVAIKLLRSIGVDISSLKDELVGYLRSKERGDRPLKELHAPVIKQYGKNLVELARDDRFDPVIGRDKETDRIIRILCRKNKNNPCLIGEAGVGKTAIVEGLAKRISDGNVPLPLRDKSIVSVDLTSMVAGAKYRGDFEERIKNIVAEVVKNKNTILFIDEIHTIVGAGAAEGAIDAANILKPQLSRGDIQVIGATTVSEYHKYIEKDPALERRFQPILIEEPTEDETIRMISGIKHRYEKHHRVKIDDEAIEECVRLSVKYMSDRFLPDKAIDIIDEACALVSQENNADKGEIEEVEEKMRQLYARKEDAVTNQDFTMAIKLKQMEDIYKEEYERLLIEKSAVFNAPSVRPTHIKQIVSEICNVPLNDVNRYSDYSIIEAGLRDDVLGQDHAIESLICALKRRDSGLCDEERPRGVFLFLGESGVGKTALATSLSKHLFHTDGALLRFDMSEYSEKHSISKLIGSPPGYAGHDEGGMLTERVRRKPYCVILFDEIEKANSEVLNILLQIADYGNLTDGTGRKVNFKNTIIIMTSNAGLAMRGTKSSLGFVEKNKSGEVDEDVLKRYFTEEFLNRFDEIISFSSLSDETMSDIAYLRLMRISDRLKKRGIELSFDKEICAWLVNAASKRGYGARPLLRFISRKIETPLTDILLSSDADEAKVIKLGVSDGEIAFKLDKALSVEGI